MSCREGYEALVDDFGADGTGMMMFSGNTDNGVVKKTPWYLEGTFPYVAGVGWSAIAGLGTFLGLIKGTDMGIGTMAALGCAAFIGSLMVFAAVGYKMGLFDKEKVEKAIGVTVVSSVAENESIAILYPKDGVEEKSVSDMLDKVYEFLKDFPNRKGEEENLRALSVLIGKLHDQKVLREIRESGRDKDIFEGLIEHLTHLHDALSGDTDETVEVGLKTIKDFIETVVNCSEPHRQDVVNPIVKM